MKKINKLLLSLAAAGTLLIGTLPLSGCAKNSDELVLRVSNWEEYIDLGDWEKDERIDVYNPYSAEKNGIIGVNHMVDDFTEWFNGGDYGFKVRVEYSTFGTNEDLYNRLNLGDMYDLVCPSDYMIMQLMRSGKLEKYSESFHDASIPTNYYTQNISPFILEGLDSFGGNDYAAGYMWGTTGIVYNPELVQTEDISSFNILRNKKYAGKVTIKDNVRDSYFPTLGLINADELTDPNTTKERCSEILNDTNGEMIAKAQDVLKEIKENVYAFETDSGKSDMITGKVAANYQWSGDAVYIMNEADDDDNPTELWYSVPNECTNLWFDGWVMLKDGIQGDEKKRTAAEAFVNFVSRPDNAIRNMYYIGYTSAIAGQTVYDYVNLVYGEESGKEYSLSNFFGEDYAPIYVDDSTLEIEADGAINRGRQLFAQYPPKNITDRSVIMQDFGDSLKDINLMWINVRCLDVKDFNPAIVWSVVAVALAAIGGIVLYKFRYRIFYRRNKANKK